MELQCNFQMKYIGTPMLHYCPMTKLEKRLEELEIILDGVSNQFQTFLKINIINDLQGLDY